MTDPHELEERPELESRPPILGSWTAIYTLLLSTLAILVAIFWLITDTYA